MMLLNENQNFQDTTNKSATPNFDHNNSYLQNNTWMSSTGSIKISKHQPVDSPFQGTTSQAISFSKRRTYFILTVYPTLHGSPLPIVLSNIFIPLYNIHLLVYYFSFFTGYYYLTYYLISSYYIGY